MGVGDKVGVRVTGWVGVAGIVAKTSAVGVSVVKRATRIVEVGVGVERSKVNSLNRQASMVTTHKAKAKIIRFFRLKFLTYM